MTFPGSKLYYSTVAVPPDVWALESNVFKLSLQDSMLDRSRLLTFSVSNPYNTIETANRYFRYQRIQLFDRVSGIRIFLGRVERIEPKYSEEAGQYLEITCRDYIQEFFERTLNTNYTPAQKRSAIVSSIITNYRYGTIIQQDVEASGSSDLVTRNYTNTDIKGIEAIETLALEDKWDNTPTGYGYDYYVDDEPRFWYFKRGTKPTSNALVGGMIISLGSPSQSPRVKHMLSDYIFPFNPLETVTRVTVYGKDGAGVTISATVTDAALEAALGIVKQMEVTDVMIPYDTSAAAAAAGQAGNSCEDRADAILAYYSGNVLRASIKIVNYPTYSMAPEISGGAKLGHIIAPDIPTSLWNFDEGTGTIAADDYNSNHLTISNGAWVTGYGNSGYAISFNGATTTATRINATGLPTSVISIVAWVYPTVLANWKNVMAHDVTLNGGWSLNLDAAGNLNFSIWDNVGGVHTASLGGIVVNTWYRVAGTYDGTNIYCYINGTISAAANAPGINLDNSGDIWVGHNSGIDIFSGTIDEVALYPVALTTNQVTYRTATSHAFRMVSRTSTGGSFWNFDEGNGTVASDIYKWSSITLYNNVSWNSSGIRGYCLSLDGTDDYGEIANPTTFNFANDFTIITWIRRGVIGADHTIISKSAAGAYGAAAKQLYIDNNNLLILDASGVGSVSSIGTVDTNWHQVAITYLSSTNTVRIYIDGAEDNNGNLVLGADNGAHVLRIGQRANANYYNGLIDELGFYPRVLPANNIQQLYYMRRSFAPFSYDTLRGSYIGGTGWELLRAGHRVRVINSLKSIDEDFLVLGITYVEPESISELELISTSRGRGVFGYAVSTIIAGMRGKSNMLMTQLLKT